MRKYSDKQILERIKGMNRMPESLCHMVKCEPVLVVETDRSYWALLDNSTLTTSSEKKPAKEVYAQGGHIYIIGGPISTEEE